MKKEVKIPDIAENVESGLCSSILVSEGDTVEKDQPLVEIETDKASTDIPSDYEGKVTEIKVEEGDEVKVGQVIMIIETSEEKEEKKEEAEADKEAKGGEEKKEEQEEAQDQPQEEKDEKETSPEEEKEGEEEKKQVVSRIDEDEKREAPERDEQLKDVPASPSVRKLARELGIDLTRVKGTGPGERVTHDDVKKYAKQQTEGKEKSSAKEAKALPDFSKWGSVEREQLSRIRQITGENMSYSWNTIPHVFQFDKADITELERFINNNKEKIEKKGGKLTLTSFMTKVIAMALQRFPRFNASLDVQNEELIIKKYYNIGIAVDTPQGLLVPVIKNADQKSLAALSAEITEIAQKARDKKLSTEQLQGGNFSISNLGGIGGTNFTPIIYSPQVAILGISRTQTEAKMIDGEFSPRSMLPLSLSYDHRVIDGADGARFLRWICSVLEDPMNVFM
jgi:pyruvate dehydrogenase E2 component (dihydrolipoamide acetyltransferase)